MILCFFNETKLAHLRASLLHESKIFQRFLWNFHHNSLRSSTNCSKGSILGKQTHSQRRTHGTMPSERAHPQRRLCGAKRRKNVKISYNRKEKGYELEEKSDFIGIDTVITDTEISMLKLHRRAKSV
jgi:hypothetical protein